MKVSPKRILVLSLVFNLILLSFSGYLIWRESYISYFATRAGILLGIKNRPLLTDSDEYMSKVRLFESLPTSTNSVFFVGDSITAGTGAAWPELLGNQNVKNRGISGDTTAGLLKRLHAIESSPDKIFLMIGVNDLRQGRSIGEIVVDYDKILEELTTKTPKTKIFIQSVLPIDFHKYPYRYHLRNNEQIINLNTEIKRLSQKYNLPYLDIYSLMLSQDGQIKSDVTTDGIHLSQKGYDIWKDAIRQYVH